MRRQEHRLSIRGDLGWDLANRVTPKLQLQNGDKGAHVKRLQGELKEAVLVTCPHTPWHRVCTHCCFCHLDSRSGPRHPRGAGHPEAKSRGKDHPSPVFPFCREFRRRRRHPNACSLVQHLFILQPFLDALLGRASRKVPKPRFNAAGQWQPTLAEPSRSRDPFADLQPKDPLLGIIWKGRSS